MGSVRPWPLAAGIAAVVVAGIAAWLLFAREPAVVGELPAPSLVQVCSGVSAGGTLAATCKTPPAAGHVLLASVCASNAAVTPAEGFTSATASGAPTYYRVVTAETGASVTVAGVRAGNAVVQMTEWAGVEPLRPLFGASAATRGVPPLPPADIDGPALPVVAACVPGTPPRLRAAWTNDGLMRAGGTTALVAHGAAAAQPGRAGNPFAAAASAGLSTTIVWLNPIGSARAYAFAVPPPRERRHVNVVTYGCADASVPCGGATPVPAAWWAENATMMMASRSDMAAFKAAGGAHLLFYTDPNKVVPSKREALWNLPEAAFCHSSLPAQTVTVTSTVDKGIHYVKYSGNFAPRAGNTALADTLGDPDDIKILSADPEAHTFSADFGKPHRAPFVVALNRLYNTQNNPRGVNAAEDRHAYGNDNLIVPSKSNGFTEGFGDVLRGYASIHGADYVEIDDVYGDYPSVLYNFFTETGASARSMTCAEAPTREVYHHAVVLEFLIVVAQGLLPIADGASNFDTTQRNNPPGPSENAVFHPYVSGDLNNEGCINGTPLYKGETLWLADQTQALTATGRRKINICMTQTSTGAGEALNAARIFFYASNMLVFDPQYTYLLENLATGRASIFIFPEEQLVPSSPVQTASREDVRSLKYGYPKLSNGAFFREFADCWQHGRPIGACAFFVNPTGRALTMPPQHALAAHYRESAAVNSPDLYDGGTLTWSRWSLPPSLSPQSAFIVRQ